MIKIMSVKNDPKDLKTYTIKYQETKDFFWNVVSLSSDEPGIPEFDEAFKTLRKDFCILAAIQPAETVKGVDPIERVLLAVSQPVKARKRQLFH